MNEKSGLSPGSPDAARGTVNLAEFQKLIREMYYEKDVSCGIDGTLEA